jgi:hypothetical protein
VSADFRRLTRLSLYQARDRLVRHLRDVERSDAAEARTAIEAAINRVDVALADAGTAALVAALSGARTTLDRVEQQPHDAA